MSYTIYKYPLEFTNTQPFVLPLGSKILTVQMQNDKPFIWVLFNNAVTQTEVRELTVVGTGYEFNLSTPGDKYVGTFQENSFVWHLFERKQHENSFS